jgi:hypothetical protein
MNKQPGAARAGGSPHGNGHGEAQILALAEEGRVASGTPSGRAVRVCAAGPFSIGLATITVQPPVCRLTVSQNVVAHHTMTGHRPRRQAA